MSGHTKNAEGRGGMAHTNCPVCAHSLHKPVLLTCLHSVCTGCAINCRTEKGLVCPVCNTAAETEALPTNHFLENMVEVEKTQRGEEIKLCAYCMYEQNDETAQLHCLQCGDHVCRACADAHRRTKLTRDHALVPLVDIAQGQHQDQLRAHQGVACSEHPLENVKFFCLKCEDLICRECKVSAHEKHNCTELQQVSEGFRRKMAVLLDTVTAKAPDMQQHLANLDEYSTQVQHMADTIAEAVEQQAKRLHLLIDQHKEEMLEQLSKSVERETVTVEEKQKSTQQNLSMLQSAEAYVSFFFSNAKAEEILLPRHLVSERLLKLSRLNPDALSSKLSMCYGNGPPATEQQLHSIFGKLEIFHIPVNKPRAKSPPALENSLPLPPAPTELRSIGERVRMLQSFECIGKVDQKDIWPTGVTTDNSGNIVVVDRENKVVKLFEWTGRLLQEIGRRQLRCPYDVTFLPTHQLAVSDHEDEDIKIFALPNGEHLRTLKGVVKYPRGISHNSRGHLLVVDAHHRAICVMDDDGRLLTSIQAADTTDSGFSDPHYISINYDDNILLSDWTAPHVKAFTPEGRLRGAWLQQDLVLQPHGICTDAQGCVLVADNQRHRVLLLAPDGRMLRTLVSKEHGLWHPMALTISPLGYLVVTEALGRVKVFKYK